MNSDKSQSLIMYLHLSISHTAVWSHCSRIIFLGVNIFCNLVCCQEEKTATVSGATVSTFSSGKYMHKSSTCGFQNLPANPLGRYTCVAHS